MNKGVAFVVLSAAMSFLSGATWEPFIAKVVRKVTGRDANGAVTKTEVIEDTWKRSRDGSLRREVRHLVNGKPAGDLVVTLHASDGRLYYLQPSTRLAELVDGTPGTPEDQYQQSVAGSGQRQVIGGVPCRLVKTVWVIPGKKTGGGQACRAEGYGILIFERTEGPTPDGSGRTLSFESDLVEFHAGEAPDPSEMQVPPGFEVRHVKQPDIPCAGCLPSH